MKEQATQINTEIAPPQDQHNVIPPPAPPEVNKKYALLSRFWYDMVLGVTPPATNNLLSAQYTNNDRKEILYDSLHERLVTLAGELGIPIIKKSVAELPTRELNSYGSNLLAADDTRLTTQKKNELNERLHDLEIQEKKALSPTGVLMMQSEKEKIYLELVKGYTSSLGRSVFSYLPSQAAKHKVGDCSLTTALSFVIAEEAQIDVEAAHPAGHVLLVVHTKDGSFTGIDMTNKGEDTVGFNPGGDFHGQKTFVLHEEDTAKTRHSLFIRESKYSFPEAIFLNTNYYLGKENEYRSDLAKSQFKEEDEQIRNDLAQNYGYIPLKDLREELFGKAPEYKLSKEWQEEEKKVQNVTEQPRNGGEKAEEEKKNPGTETTTARKIAKASLLSRFFSWIKSGLRRIGKWMSG